MVWTNKIIKNNFADENRTVILIQVSTRMSC